MEYWARITQERKNRRFLIEFPAAPGCQTFADTADEVYTVALEAIEGWLEAHLVTGEAPPQVPSGRPEASGMMIPIYIPTKLSVRLAVRCTRQALGLSQAALAKRVGVTKQQISLIESPDANLTVTTLEKIAAGLELEIDITLRPRVAPPQLVTTGG